MLLDKIKNSLKVDGTDFDIEITDLMDAAKADLKLKGVIETKIVDTDPLIIRAITSYCKAYFSSDNSEADRYLNSYNSISTHLTLSSDYNSEV